MVTIPINDLHDPRLDPFRDLKQGSKTRWTRKIVTEGWRVTQRLLSSDLVVDAVLMSQRKVEQHAAMVPPAVPLLVAPQAICEQLVGFNFHAGVLGLAARPPQGTLEEWIQPVPDRDCIVAFPRVVDPENVGMILRSAAAFGVRRVLLGGHSASPYSRRSLRLSMGAAFSLSIFETANFETDLRWLCNQAGYRAIAAVCQPEALPPDQIPQACRNILVVGNESHGLAPATVELCAQSVFIPIARPVESLNVTMATTILLYELTRSESGKWTSSQPPSFDSTNEET